MRLVKGRGTARRSRGSRSTALRAAECTTHIEGRPPQRSAAVRLEWEGPSESASLTVLQGVVNVDQTTVGVAAPFAHDPKLFAESQRVTRRYRACRSSEKAPFVGVKDGSLKLRHGSHNPELANEYTARLSQYRADHSSSSWPIITYCSVDSLGFRTSLS